MIVHTTALDEVFGTDLLGRFTAAVITTVPEFDPGDTPIGHALAAEFFRAAAPEPAAEPGIEAVVLAPEQVYEWPSSDEPVRRPSPRPRIVEAPPVEDDEPTGTVLELPVAASSVEWFGITTEPDEEIDEPVRRAG